MAKMDAFCAAHGFSSIHFLNNNCYWYGETALCGTRSWLFDVGEPHDAKVMNRELCRLRASLQSAGEAEKLVFLHYPPLYPAGNADRGAGSAARVRHPGVLVRPSARSIDPWRHPGGGGRGALQAHLRRRAGLLPGAGALKLRLCAAGKLNKLMENS